MAQRQKGARAQWLLSRQNLIVTVTFIEKPLSLRNTVAKTEK